MNPMGSSYVERGPVGFWANDDYLRELMRGMAEGVDVLPDPPPWLREARDEWRRDLAAKRTVGVVLDLDALATSSERVAALEKLAARARPAEKPESLFAEVVAALRQLLKGEWTMNAATSPVLPRVPKFQEWLHDNPEHQMIFLCWVRLENEQFRNEPGESTADRLCVDAWESKDVRVRAAWEALTRPQHLSALELWYKPAEMNPMARASTEAALRECRARQL